MLRIELAAWATGNLHTETYPPHVSVAALETNGMTSRTLTTYL
jgi:hypothetical protein